MLMREVLSSNSLFSGYDTARIPRHNAMALARKVYFFVGQVFALSLIHGGPAPKCLASAIADYIVFGIEKVKVSIKDVPEESIQTKLKQVKITMCRSARINVMMYEYANVYDLCFSIA